MIDFLKTEAFLDRIFLELLRDGVDVSYFELDHICYRVETLGEYTEQKVFLEGNGELISENEIGGRHIAIYKLEKPIVYQNRKISILELPAPKQGSSYKTGFEHVEFVIDEKLEKFMETYPDLKFKTKALSRGINPDISLNYGDISVKFHQDTLEDIIAIEQE